MKKMRAGGKKKNSLEIQFRVVGNIFAMRQLDGLVKDFVELFNHLPFFRTEGSGHGEKTTGGLSDGNCQFFEIFDNFLHCGLRYRDLHIFHGLLHDLDNNGMLLVFSDRVWGKAS